MWHVSKFYSSLKLNNIPLYVHVTPCLYVYLTLGVDPDCLHPLAFAKNVVMDVGVLDLFEKAGIIKFPF